MLVASVVELCTRLQSGRYARMICNPIAKDPFVPTGMPFSKMRSDWQRQRTKTLVRNWQPPCKRDTRFLDHGQAKYFILGLTIDRNAKGRDAAASSTIRTLFASHFLQKCAFLGILVLAS